ncbi:MAG: site-2 protease family protein [Desulfobacula sp.]|jgi:Zn-dependent protease|uniref:site-2 protease family protein n=1 Tax=Desulfobacula sp. TaxID=2593537 RepID=UPI001D8D3074|nr:site-2 protease family protein [Desulfobacula sp.]MBT3486073.1 site-2 protease family protein [Desulfobacula sp.]MBT3804469.1 site-2 protease family protein [Desulfobacula sp.]MBT4024937.1 site-2 protease family protein [Desulfobacula sp.]MBT4198831.1 site-2 protease family protein [Desulfobacula sp.]
MGLLSLLINNPIAFLLISIPLMYAIIFHELAHGYVAYRLGDPTAKHLGRLSLNPLKHLDPLGTLMLFLVGFGWAKPVPVNFSYIRDYRKGMILVSSAGIITNMILAFLALFLYRLLNLPQSSMLALMLYFFAKINIILAAFNLIPIPPLDGSKILLGFSPASVQAILLRLERFGFLIVIALLYFGVLDPVIDFLQRVILSLINILLP